jgi:ABC-2 type transport system permease protein
MTTLANLGPTLQPAPPLMPARRILGAYLTEAKFEFVGSLRTIAFAVPFLLLPVLIYLLFGVVMSADAIAKNPKLADYLFCSFSVFAVTGPAIFGIGCGLAMERDAGLLKLKRALPLPPGAYLMAKMLMAMMFAALTFSSLLITALIVGKLTLSALQLSAIAVVMIVGVLPFCALGLFIGAYVSGSAAPAVANLIYLPMMWLGGLFVPLPKFLQGQLVIWPSFHLNQIATGVAGLGEFHFIPTSLAIGVLVGVTVLFGGLALHRLARKG